MTGFFKGLLKGLLYVLFLPFGLLGILIYAVFGLFVFIFQFGKLIYLFFTGRNLQSDLPEDIEVKKILEKNAPKEEEKKEEDKDLSMSLYPSDSIVYGSGYSSPTLENKEEETPNNDEAAEENLENEEEEEQDV